MRAFIEGVPRTGFEPVAHSLEGCCSIQLSYRGKEGIKIKLKDMGKSKLLMGL